jgi:transposase
MFAGIDVSKKWVDVALADGPRLDRASPLKAAAWLKKHGATLVALEATGGYELPMVAALRQEDIPVARLNPRQARHLPRRWVRKPRVIAPMPPCSPATPS